MSDAASCNEQGVALAGRGEHASAIAQYDAALRLDPTLTDAWANRGNSLVITGHFAAADASYRQALVLHPEHGAAWLGLAYVAMSAKSWRAAIDAYDAALAALGPMAMPMVYRGNALLHLGEVDAALADYDAAIAVAPNNAHGWNGKAAALARLYRNEEALEPSRRAMALAPQEAAVLGTYAAVLCGLGRNAEALPVVDQAIALQPGDASLHHNRALALHGQRRFAEAQEAYRAAYNIDPDAVDAHWNEALLLLAQGDYATGWAKYEWGWRNGIRGGDRGFGPPWLGETPMGGRRLLLHAEQGMGDTLQFIRYAKLAADAGAIVHLEVQAPLVRLLRRLPHVASVVAFGEASPEFDLHCPLMSLPLAFRTLWHTVPRHIPYLITDPARTDAWRARLPPGLRVGVVWSGDPRRHQPSAHLIDRRRSLHASQLAPLAGINVCYVSLQKGEPAGQPLPDGLTLLDRTDALHDFADTADLVAALDLVISVDTAVAHVAGALGVPVWLLNRHDSCWRWRMEGDLTPWYPTMRLFRQEQAGDWDSVLSAVRASLLALAATRR